MFATLLAPSVGDDIRVAAVRGVEALCRPYEFQVHFMLSSGDPVDIKSAIGSNATLTLGSDEDKHDICGLLVSIRLLAQTSAFAVYEALLVPQPWYLGLTKHSRVFTKMTVPDVIKEVLESSNLTGAGFELRLSADYPVEELIVQYRESRLDFIHRWMEHEGIYYFFEHADGADKMIIVDDRSAHSSLAPDAIRYRPMLQDDVSAGRCFDVFQAHYSTTVRRVKLADYDYARPMLDVSADADVSDRGVGEMHFHRARFWDPAEARRYAKIRADELKCREVVVHAHGTTLHMGAGYQFELSEHPEDSYNKKYLATEVVHFVNQVVEAGGEAIAKLIPCEFPEQYRVQVTALDETQQYRPPRTSRRPRVWGYENGVVDGEATSEYAQIDDQGRYLVKFMFDESTLEDGKASTYVRMMQPHGGTTEGFHFPLRKGTEVIFTFQGGDPDRPVIAGVVPNMTTPSPVAQANHTQNVIRTGANNYFILDDNKGSEFIALRTPKNNSGLYFGNPINNSVASFNGEGDWFDDNIFIPDWDLMDDGSIFLHTAGHTNFAFGGNWAIGCKNITETADGTVTETYKGHHLTTVTTGGRKEVINGLQEEEYKNSHKITVTGSQTIKVTTTRDDTVDGAVTEIYGSLKTTSKGLLDVHAKASETHTVTGTYLNKGSDQAKFDTKKFDVIASAKIYMDAPAVHIKTPDWNVENPKQSIITANSSWMWGLANWQLGTQIECKGFALGVTGIKAEAAGIASGAVGLELAAKGAVIEAGGVEARTKALKSFVGGLSSKIAGLISNT